MWWIITMFNCCLSKIVSGDLLLQVCVCPSSFGCVSCVNFSPFQLLQHHCINSNKLATHHPWRGGFKLIQMKGNVLFQGEIRKDKNRTSSFKIFSKPPGQDDETYMKAFWHTCNADLGLFKSCPRGSMGLYIYIGSKLFKRMYILIARNITK